MISILFYHFVKKPKSLLDIIERVEKVTEVGILPIQWLPLVALALCDQALRNDAELLAVGQGLPVGVGGRCDKQGVDLSKEQS